MARKGTELRPIMVRIPEELRARLARSAKRNDRSMNAEIIHRIEQSFRDDAYLKAEIDQRESLEKSLEDVMKENYALQEQYNLVGQFTKQQNIIIQKLDAVLAGSTHPKDDQ